MHEYRTDECDKYEHGRCGGTVNVFDTSDGPNQYVCGCSCHERPREVTCPECKGTGKTTSRSWTNDPAVTTG